MKNISSLAILFMLVPVTSGQNQSDNFLSTLQKHTLEIGPEISHIKYKESGIMEEGIMYGITASYTYRSWVLFSDKESESFDKWLLKAEGKYSWGELDYDGALWDGTPYTLSNIDNFMVEIRGLAGIDLPDATIMNTVYAGIGYRYLNDDGSSNPFFYERESNYLYMPIGIETIRDLKNGWSFGCRGEFDIFLLGMQISHLSDVGLSDVENRQNEGYGLRGSIKLRKKTGIIDLIIEPFVRYWDIEQSEVDHTTFGIPVVEPANESLEYGIRFISRH